MKWVNACLVATALLLSSCATPPIFDFQTGSNLIPGSTTTAQARQILGPPNDVSRVKNSNEDFSLWNYKYARVLTNGDFLLNEVTLTFQKDLLLKYCYLYNSGTELPQNIQITSTLDQLRNGASTKKDVISALGEPASRAGCRDSEKDSTEVCSWEQPLNKKRFRYVTITFDAAGAITKTSLIESPLK
jgi:hypothetical protein